MPLDLDDTIAAIASAPGGALRGIVRLSGPHSVACVARIFQPAGSTKLSSVSGPRRIAGDITLPRGLPPCPAALYLWPTRHSYTRQPSAEFHLPGSPPLAEAALEAACEAGARLAGPGEFTLRAFLAGRLDLTQAEAVLGVIDAQSAPELEAALAQLAGGLARPLARLRGDLLDLLAQIEAGLDFADEEIERIESSTLDRELDSAAAQVAALLERMSGRRQAGCLPRVVLVGLPNAGKSSLLNALAGKNAAIVAPVAGTTRDFVECRVRFGDTELLLVDTAGEQPGASDFPAAEAQRLARDQAARADLVLRCFAVDQPHSDRSHAVQPTTGKPPAIVVWTKGDLAASPPRTGVCTSSRTGAGLDILRQQIAMRLHGDAAGNALAGSAVAGSAVARSAVAGTADRCRDSLRLAGEALGRARSAVRLGEELVAAELRVALDELGRVAGAVYTDDVLDRIFSRFCIGK